MRGYELLHTSRKSLEYIPVYISLVYALAVYCIASGAGTSATASVRGALSPAAGGVAAAAAIKVPTLVILAAADKMTPAKAGRAMAAAIAGAELIEVSGAGHMLPAEKPLQVNNHITRFLSA